MLEGMLDAVRGCLKEEMRMDIISNNLANFSVIGFKKDVISFQDLLEQASEGGDRTGKMGTADMDLALVQIKTDSSQGDLHFTGNTLDFAIFGEGFFKVMTPDGVRYTRRGSFRMDEKRFLVTQEGNRVLGPGGPIEIPDGDVNVNGEGAILVNGSERGRIAIARFENTTALAKDGLGCFRNVNDEPELTTPSDSQVQQGYLELSNVSATKEMVNMINSLRAFESYQKAIQILDGINSQVINQVGSVK